MGSAPLVASASPPPSSCLPANPLPSAHPRQTADNLAYTDGGVIYVHQLEFAASFIEVVASLGWAYTWWLTCESLGWQATGASCRLRPTAALPSRPPADPRTVGRGWTLDDPDFWGIVFIVVPSLVYLTYNVRIFINPADYATDVLYTYADILYAIGAYFYVFAALRDDGWLWWAPHAGRLYGGIDDKVPFPARGDAQAAVDGVLGSCLGLDCGCCDGGGPGGGRVALVDSDAPLIAGSGSGYYSYSKSAGP